MMAELESLRKKIETAWQKFSSREKTLIGLMLVVFLSLGLYLSMSPLFSWISDQKQYATDKQKFLDKLRTNRDKNVLAVSRVMAFEEKLKSTPLDLSTYLSTIAQKTFGSDLSGLEPQKDQTIKGDIIARTVKLTCTAVTQRMLVQFFADIENNPKSIVYVTALNIRGRPASTGKLAGEMLDAEVWVTNYFRLPAKQKNGQ